MDLFLDRDGINELNMGLQPALRSLGGFAAPVFVRRYRGRAPSRYMHRGSGQSPAARSR